ncbi:EsaB/YukD family protein [Corynebacterium terpenotabidum]|uniref:Type VII secretion integral membrane protein EccD n=1 Tax=Corynebacterium terpenotabidum Y-11 TaxID=1200352 RepID=S4XG69_9CORY|nr:EsaB/YukD family protein [Corynebacterium terpenotabidum]AGP31531.1 hypothetical protein A606_09460 [Corynebacterium terpenotabidum Y-11]
MIAVSISVIDDAGPDGSPAGHRARVVDATVSATVPVAELIPHLVDATPGEHWQLSGAGGILRPEYGLDESGVRPGERLTLARATVPAPPTDTVGRLSEDLPPNPAVWVAAGLVAAATLVLPPFTAGAPVWHPLEISDRARSILDGSGDPGGPAATAATALTLIIAVACAAGSLHDRRVTALAAVLAFSVGVQVNVVTGCVLATCAVWRPGPERVITVALTLAAAVNFRPGVTVLLGMTGLVIAGQTALGLAGVRLPRIPATGLFAAVAGASSTAGSTTSSEDADAAAVPRARTTHAALVIAACTVILAGVVQLIPPGTRPGWTTVAGCLAVAVTGLSARGVRPVHAVTVTVTAVTVAVWTLVHCPGYWPLAALLPVALPAVRITSPLAGRVIDILETVAFAVAVPALIATTGVFDLVRGIG